MAGFYPVPATRSTNLLAQTRLIQQMHADQLALTRLQTQISTGRRIERPGDDPAAAIRAISLQRLLELKAQAQTNVQSARSYLDAADTALSHVSQIVTEVRGTALVALSDTSSPAERQAAAAQVQQAIQQILASANQQFRGRYLFAGSRSTQPPYVATDGGIAYRGNEQSLATLADVDGPVATGAAGQAVFGGLSSSVTGSIDLNPALTADTPISALRGGQGLTLGSIRIGDGTTSQIVDLSSAATIGDVARLIEAHPPQGRTLTVTVGPAGLIVDLDDAGGGNLSIKEVGGGTTAADLGLLNELGSGTAPIVGGDLDPALRLATRLLDLQTASPLDLTSGLLITQGQASYVVDTSSAVTVEDLLVAIERSGAQVIAGITSDGKGLSIRSALSGVDFAIGENGGSTATQLGVRSLTEQTLLADLNYGRGVATAAGADFIIHRKDGTELAIDLSSAVTVGDVLSLINDDPANQDPGTRVVARLATVGNGIELVDQNVSGSDLLSIRPVSPSRAAFDLGLIPPGATSATAVSDASGDTLRGTDPHPQEVSGLMNALLRLHAALVDFDPPQVERAIQLLDAGLDTLNFARADLGAHNQMLTTLGTQLEDQSIQLRSDLSQVLDTDLTQAISDLAARQAAYDASLKLAAQVFRNTLLDYL